MPYKDKAKQREATRRNTAKWRSRQGITKKNVIPKKVKPKPAMPTGKISNYPISEILTKIEQLAEQQKIFYDQLLSSKIKSLPIIKLTPKGKKLIFYVYE